MRIAVISEFSAKDKNPFILEALKPSGAQIFNVGMSGAPGENELTYIHTGLIAGIALASGAADFVVGGCGTGQGFMISAMQYPGVFCGLITTPLDAFLFSQINAGNCISLALNKGYGWAGDIDLKYIFEKLFAVEAGGGYPVQRRESQAESRRRLENISAIAHKGMAEILGAIDPAILEPVRGHKPFMDFIGQYAVVKFF